MKQPFARLALAAVLSCLIALSAYAWQPRTDTLYKAPVTPLEYWGAIGLERDLGSPEMAAKLLHQLVLKTPTDAQLLEIVDKEKQGTLALARLVAVVRWSEDDKLNKQARKDAETLLVKAQEAVRKRATDRVYITRLIGMLRGDREQQSYATRELVRLRENTVPYLLDELGRNKEPADRLAVRRVLERIGSEAAGPLVAALDGYPKNPDVKLEVLDLLRNKYGAQSQHIVPFLRFPSASREENNAVRVKARKLLADFLEIPAGRVQPAKVALTREAERYLNKRVKLLEPVDVWRWDGTKIVRGLPGGGLPTAARAEEFYGTKFAQQALTLDPEYKPAQTVLLTLLLDRSPRPLPASLKVTVDRADLTLLLEVMSRALKEERPNVLLPVIEAVGARAEVRAKRPLTTGEPGLVRALEYPDARVRLAAVKALLAIPGKPPAATARRILEILKRALSPTAAYVPGNKVMVAVGDAAWRGRVMEALRGVKLEPIEASSGRDAMRKLKADASIQVLVTESTLPHPGLAHFLAQLRADRGLKSLPVILAAVPESRAAYDANARFAELQRERRAMLVEATPFVRALEAADHDHATRLRSLLKEKATGPKLAVALKRALDAFDQRIADAALDNKADSHRLDAMVVLTRDLKAMIVTPSLTTQVGLRDVETYIEQHEKVRKQVQKDYTSGTMVLKRLEKIEDRSADEADRYGREAAIRENALTRFVTRYRGVSVVPASSLADARKVVPVLQTVLRTFAPPPAAAVAADAETAIRILRDLALGHPPGYNIAPVGVAILDSLHEGRLSEKGQLYAIEAAGALTGPRPQMEFGTVVLAGDRPLAVRTAAAEALIRHVQKVGNQLPASLGRQLRELASQPKLDARLKEKLDLLAGIVGSGSTGSRLRDYRARPVPIIPPPKE